MTGDFGLSFAPTAQNQEQNAQQGSQSPIQDAIKVLSLRIPSFVGAQGIAPNALLGGAGSGGVPGASAPGGVPGGLDDWLRRMLMGMGNPMGGGQQAPPMGAPTPNVKPGEEARMGPVNDSPTMPGGIVKPGGFAPSAEQGRPQMPVLGRQPFKTLA